MILLTGVMYIKYIIGIPIIATDINQVIKPNVKLTSNSLSQSTDDTKYILTN